MIMQWIKFDRRLVHISFSGCILKLKYFEFIYCIKWERAQHSNSQNQSMKMQLKKWCFQLFLTLQVKQQFVAAGAVVWWWFMCSVKSLIEIKTEKRIYLLLNKRLNLLCLAIDYLFKLKNDRTNNKTNERKKKKIWI